MREPQIGGNLVKSHENERKGLGGSRSFCLPASVWAFFFNMPACPPPSFGRTFPFIFRVIKLASPVASQEHAKGENMHASIFSLGDPRHVKWEKRASRPL